MKFVPHNYQQHAINYIQNHPVSAIFLDMGLGKTVITLTALNHLLFDSFTLQRVLIIAPLRVARDTWPQEIEKWAHLKHLSYAIAVGTKNQRIAALEKQADLTIINRENVTWLIEDSGISFDYDMIVIDELSSFKNHHAKRFKSLLKVRPQVQRIVGLTGTPTSNGLMDLWAQFRLLDMGKRLGRFISTYREDYFIPDKRKGQTIFSYKPLPDAEEAITQQISDITISMKSTDLLEMPELISTQHQVRLSTSEQKKYQKLKNELALTLTKGEITAANAAVLSGKLSQMANGAIYTDDEKIQHIHHRKLEALADLIEAANGKPLLVAYWFKHDRSRIKAYLTEKGINFAILDSPESIRKWNAGDLPVALLHPASAGHGLNLQAGGATLIWFGLTWSLELYQQTNARLFRQGQRAKTVVIQHIVCAGTIDEQILRALSRKEHLQTNVIQAVKAELKS